MIKVSVVTITARPGYIDTMVESLTNQTMRQNEWEFILVDDFVNERYEAVKKTMRGKIRNFKHIPPREIKPYAAPCLALNTGIAHCHGELIYFMADYLYPSPRCLERHWEIYNKYGPRVLISGPLIDAIVADGGSVWKGARPRLVVEGMQSGKTTAFLSWSPPIFVPLKDNFSELVPENYISVFKETFKPPPLPDRDLPDWRMGFICGKFIDKNLYENTTIHPWSWGWCGANDSLPLEALLEVNGFDESFEGRHGGADGDISCRLMHIGGGDVWREGMVEPARTSRYLVDTLAPAYELIHPAKKKVILSETERMVKVEEARAEKAIPNDYSLREERERILKGL
ncbi:hypothetical protein LCGC14_0263280 [marine sediment metagenome]|uniref:Glycosyltransferase 2-like domain-containing protein n=1 Tax=marine sediment metagenome TaxID=412755 RepID=A0A0F9X645_9ZZZZ